MYTRMRKEARCRARRLRAFNMGGECCLCGDIGFQEDLIPCPLCGFRLQHSYCSSSYPRIDMKTWRCEWCIHDQEKQEPHINKGRPDMAATNHSMNSIPSESFRDETHRGKTITESVGDVNETGNRSTRVNQDNKTVVGRTISTTGKVITRKQKVTVYRPKKPNRCHSALHRVASRRYKLLADVLC